MHPAGSGGQVRSEAEESHSQSVRVKVTLGFNSNRKLEKEKARDAFLELFARDPSTDARA